jgi:hypothetical protein
VATLSLLSHGHTLGLRARSVFVEDSLRGYISRSKKRAANRYTKIFRTCLISNLIIKARR